MPEELELVKISELPDASNVTATDVFPVVQNNVTKKVTAPIIRKYVVDSLGSAAKASTSDFEPSGSVLEVDLKTQERADEQNKRIDRIEVAAYLLRNNKIFKAYRTKALMLADVANIPANSLVHVVNDPANNAETNDINGQYHYDGNDFLKLPDGFLDLINEKSDQVLESSKSYTDGRITSLQQTSATDASTKATAAKDDAIHAAGLDAQIKADDAETAAIAAAAADATTKAATAKSEAIAVAATDASTKANNAETNAKLAAQNTDVNLLLALQQIAQIISDNRDELDVTDAALSAEDQLINTRVTRLLLAIQQLALTISDNRDELDVLIANNSTAINANVSTLNSLQASTTLEDQNINTRLAYLLLSIQQLALTISDNRDELDVLIATNASAINANVSTLNSLQASTTLEDQNINTRLAYLLLSIQQIVLSISDTRDELDVTDTALLAEDQSINTRVTRLNAGLQGIVDSINQMLIDLDDPLAYFTEANKLDRLIRQQEFVTELVKLDGFDPANSAEAHSVLDSSLLFAFDKPAHIIVIDVTTAAALPTSKLKTITTTNPDGSTTTTYLDNVISAEIQVNVDGEILHSFCSMQVQGASSAGYAKKNWTFGFTDKQGVYNSNGIAEFSGNDILLKIGDVKPHQEWVFKSNWIDHTHIRNAMSYNLWQQVMLTRNVFPLRDIDNSYVGKTGLNAQDTSATGHPILYPALLRVNGAFYGIGSLGLGKKRQNYNISKNVATEILIGANNWADIKVLDYTTLDSVGDPTYFEVKAPSTVSKAATYIENFRLFANMSLADFTTNISTYLDKQNIIDFYIFCDFLKTADLIGGDNFKNLQICSWTGTKFFFMPYDLDTVFGLHWAGTSIAVPPNTSTMPTTDATLFGKVYLIYKTDIETRYAQLRKLNVLTVNNIYQQSRALTSQYSNEMFSAELTRWNSAQPSLNITSLEQILNWTAQRLIFLDTKFNYVA